jgi:hypothetical protein
MKVYSQLLKARFEQVSADLSEAISGLFWQNTTSKKIKFYDGVEVKEVADTNSTQTFTNKTLTSPIVSGATVDTSTINSPIVNTPTIDVVTYVQSGVAPSNPSSGKVKMYFKNDGKAYVRDSAGTEKKVGGSGGGGSSLVWDKNTQLPPIDVSQDGIKLEGFDYLDSQELSLIINVPEAYEPNVPVKLIGGAFCTDVTTGNVLLKAETTLIRPNVSVLGTYTNTRSSTNSSVSVSTTSNMISSIGDIDLTDSNGAINSVSIQAGDKLRVRFYRDVSGEVTSATSVAKVLINNFEIKFFN